MLGLALLPPEQLLLTAALVGLGYYGGGLRGLKLAMNAGCYAVGLGLAVGVVHLLGTPSWDDRYQSALTLLVAAAVFALWNKLAVDAAIALSLGLRLREVMRPGWTMTLLVFVLNVGLAFATLALTHTRKELVVVAPVGVLLVFTARSWYLRVVQDREVWRHLELAGRELADLDETTLAEAGLRRVTALLKADDARLRVRRDGDDTVYTFDGQSMGAPQREVPLVVEGVGSSVLRTTDPDGNERTTSTVVAPLVNGEQLVGALEVSFRTHVRLSSREEGVLAAYAGTLAIALANAHLHARVQEQSEHYARAALTDSLTGLANRARLQERADPEWLAGGDRALLLLDLDGFKAVNDTHGHAVGRLSCSQVVASASSGARPAGKGPWPAGSGATSSPSCSPRTWASRPASPASARRSRPPSTSRDAGCGSPRASAPPARPSRARTSTPCCAARTAGCTSTRPRVAPSRRGRPTTRRWS